jgi:hypothetical protein
LPYGVNVRFFTGELPEEMQQVIPRIVEGTSFPREVSDDGWQVFDGTMTPPHFINDIYRFEIYDNPHVHRYRFPFEIDIKTYLHYEGEDLSFPHGGMVDINGEQYDLSAGETITLDELSDSSLALHYKVNWQTGQGSFEWLHFNKQPPPPWKMLRDDLSEMGSGKIKFVYQLGYLWNVVFIAFIIGLWYPIVTRLKELTSTHFLSYKVFVCGLVLTFIIPVIGVNDALPRLVFAGLIGAAVLGVEATRARRRTVSEIRREASELLNNLAFFKVASLFIIVCWTVLGVRFFEARYPAGFAILAGGVDSHFHYSFAREILAGDWLHTAAVPFLRQQLLRYLLLIPLVILGEGAAWGFMVQWSLYALLGVLIAGFLFKYHKNKIVAWLLLALWLLSIPFTPYKIWVPSLYPGVWCATFLVASFLFLHRFFKTNDPRVAKQSTILSAIFFGISIWTRNNMALVLPFWLLVILLKHENKTAAIKYVFVYGFIASSFVGIITLRNTLLAPEKPLAIMLDPEISSIALFQGYQLEEVTDEQMRNVGWDGEKDSVPYRFYAGLKYYPGVFAHYQIDRLLVLFGGPAFTQPNLVEFYPRFNLWHLFLWGMILSQLLRGGPKRLTDTTALLCWGMLISQVILMAFSGYIGAGYRLFAPMYPFMLILGFKDENT